MALHVLWDLLVVPKSFFESRDLDGLKRPAVGAVGLVSVLPMVGLAALVEIPAIVLGSVETYLFVESVSFTDPERAAAELEAASGGESVLSTAAWVAVTLWQGYVWREGLRGGYDVPTDRATLAAGLAVAITLLLVVLG
jgi:hypothetical protein